MSRRQLEPIPSYHRLVLRAVLPHVERLLRRPAAEEETVLGWRVQSLGHSHWTTRECGQTIVRRLI